VDNTSKISEGTYNTSPKLSVHVRIEATLIEIGTFGAA
jgi:hypothetical protein